MSFTFAYYEECLKAILASETEVELIHDIDYEPNNVLFLATLESKYNIHSTYFIRLHAKTYNALTLDNIRLWKKLIEMGHKIGLHFEPSLHSDCRKGIVLEAEMLSHYVGAPISCFSLHEPARMGTLTPDQVPEGFLYYCYDAPYYQGKKYISDSGCRWREGDILHHLGKHTKMIVNTHPNWWYHQTSAENY